MSVAAARDTHTSPLEELLVSQLKNRPRETEGLVATVALQADDGEGWTVSFERDRTSLAYGASSDADLLVSGDGTTLAGIVDGSVWGIQAFVEGRIVVRRNLALSLRMDGLFGEGPSDFHVARDVDAGGLKTFYIEAGSGTPIILLHGLAATNTSFLPTFVELHRDHRVIAPDLPGFGDSAKPVRSYDAAFYASWLIDFLDALGIEKAHLIGNSMGGRIAIETALRVPDRVDRVALLAPSPAFIRRREYARIVRFLRPELAFLPLPVPRRQVVGSIKRLFAKPERVADDWYEAAADEFIRVFSSPRGRIGFFSAARQIYLEQPYGETGFWDRLPQLSRPALFVWGEKDWLVPSGFEPHVRRCLPEVTSVVLPDCGHVPQYELPDETHRLIRQFLA